MVRTLTRKRLSLAIRIRRVMRDRFSLHDDKADDAEIEARIREGTELRGATPWILIFAIFVASVGLNVNSTAVIIGAMLISPLMGPIMGAGLGVAVYDFPLAKRSLVNLGIATIISLLVSTLYFSLTPLQTAQSELLARTTPTLWDVLIALFGGLAGVIGITRKEKSNVIPGVAIATALMPPVCTAGYGLATGQWGFVGGAFYLYAINCVFIALATVAGIRALRLKHHRFANPATEQRVKSAMILLALCTALPSGYLATKMVRHEVFKSKAQAFVSREFALTNTQVVNARFDAEKRNIDLSLIGEPIEADTLHEIQARLAGTDLDGTQIILHQVGKQQIDVTELKSSLLSDLLRDNQGALRQKDLEIARLTSEIGNRGAIYQKADDITQELRQLFPEITQVFLGEGMTISAQGKKQKATYLAITTLQRLPDQSRQKIADWFKVRAKAENVVLHFDTPAPARGKSKPIPPTARTKGR